MQLASGSPFTVWRTSFHRAALMLVVSAAATAAHAQSPSIIRGRVVADDTGDPIRNARISDAVPDKAPVISDAEGRFAIAAAPNATLSAVKTGYVKAAAPAADGLEFRLSRGGVISGHVLDDQGAPLPMMAVVAQRIVRRAGSVSFERAASAEADDRGEYRLFGLAAGDYVLATAGVLFQATNAPPRADRPLDHYYSHATKPEDAQVVQVVAGIERPGIDLIENLPSPGPQFPPVTAGPARPNLGTIRGRIVNADGVPLRLRRVTIESMDGGRGPFMATTSSDGRYEIHNLPPGAYRMRAEDLGTTPVAFGQRGPLDRGAVIDVKAGASIDDVDVALPRPAVVGGRVLDEYGDPLENASVRVYRTALLKGRRSLVTPGLVMARQTDDLGRYRISGLPPGRYIVGAIALPSAPGQQNADARTYYPATLVPDEAQAVQVASGQDALNLDIVLLRDHGARINGRVYTSSGAPFDGPISLTQSRRSRLLATPAITLHTTADGRFEFQHLAPGEYVLQAAAPRNSVFVESEFASRYVTLNGDDANGVVMRLSAGSTIEGRLRFEGAEPPEDPDMRLAAVPADPDLTSLLDDLPARADIHADLTFEIGGLSGPRRLQAAKAPDGWALKQVLVNGGDATDLPLPFGTRDQSLRDVEVVFTKQVSVVTVTASDATDRGTDFRFVAFAVDAARRYSGSRFIAVGVPGRNGTATMKGLPPGDYFVAAMDPVVFAESDFADEMGIYESLVAGAARMTLTEGETRSVSVRLPKR